MGKSGSVSLVEAPPCFEAVRSAVSESLGKSGLTIVGQPLAILRIQEAFAGDPEFVDARASGMLDLITVSTLVSKLCAAASIPTMPTLDLARQAALIGAVAQHLPDDSAFAASRRLPGFFDAVATTLQELRHERIRLHSSTLPKGKLRDIALLDEGLRDELERRSYCTLSDRIEEVIAANPSRPEEIRRVFWLPEREWPELSLQLVQWMVRAGIRIEIAVEAHPTNPGFFRMGDTLRARFPDADVRAVESPLPPGAGLFSLDEDAGWTGDLQIVEASDDFIETEFALTLCRKLIREDGLDPRQIVLFAHSLESYGPKLRAAADREALPIAVDYSEPLRAHPFVRFVLQCLRAVMNPDIGTLVALVRADYSLIEPRDRRTVEKTLRSLTRETDFWKALADEALADSPTPSWFADVARWRRIATDGHRKPLDWLRGLDMLLAQTPWLAVSSPREEAARHEMVRSLQVALLSLDPHDAFGYGKFLEFVEQTWTSAEYRVRTQGGIRVVSDPFSIGDAQAVIAVGIAEGRFPSRRAEDPVLLDRDRLTLNTMNPQWRLTDSYARAAEDDRDFYRLLCSCRNLTLCYPATIGENTQDPAAYLADLQHIAGVHFQKRTFAQRFPQAEECITERDMIGSILVHGEKFEPMESIARRVDALRTAHAQSKRPTINDEILKAKLGHLPHPLRLAHLRSLSQCPFQYFARHRLRLRSEKQDPLSRVIVNTIRRSNLLAQTEEALKVELLQSLNLELESLKGTLDEHEIQVLRFSAPTTLEQFAQVEISARKQWGLVPVQVSPADEQTGLRLPGKFGDSKVTISPSIDVLYKREATNDVVPMRIGWEAEGEQTPMENHLVMLMHPGETKYVIFDGYNRARRTLYCRRSDDKREALPFKGKLFVDIGPKKLGDLRRHVTDWMVGLLARARSGEPEATPHMRHCSRCDLASFCRSAPYADQAIDWLTTNVPEEDA